MIDRATHRSVLMYRITPDLKAGLEWNPLASEVGVVANWRVLRETQTRPALILGTSSDRIGTPSGQSYYATVSKGFGRIAPYAGASWSGYEQRVLFPFGVNVGVTENVSAMLINDGVHTHLSATWAHRNVSMTLLLVARKKLGVTIGLTF